MSPALVVMLGLMESAKDRAVVRATFYNIAALWMILVFVITLLTLAVCCMLGFDFWISTAVAFAETVQSGYLAELWTLSVKIGETFAQTAISEYYGNHSGLQTTVKKEL